MTSYQSLFASLSVCVSLPLDVLNVTFFPKVRRILPSPEALFSGTRWLRVFSSPCFPGHQEGVGHRPSELAFIQGPEHL